MAIPNVSVLVKLAWAAMCVSQYQACWCSSAWPGRRSGCSRICLVCFWAWSLSVPSAQRQELVAQLLLAVELALALLNAPMAWGWAWRATWFEHHVSKYSRQFKHRKEQQWKVFWIALKN